MMNGLIRKMVFSLLGAPSEALGGGPEVGTAASRADRCYLTLTFSSLLDHVAACMLSAGT